MSDTAYGTVVLHITPEAVGGPLPLVETVTALHSMLRHASCSCWLMTLSSNARAGYQTLYVEHVLQPDRGRDLNFLVGRRSAGIPPRESH